MLPTYSPFLEPYVLTQEDTNIVSSLWRKIKTASRNTNLLIPITRFDDLYMGGKLEDKLIDCWIALEAMFFALIPKEFVGSMGETVASTIAYYLGKTDSERRSIYAFMISSHKARGYYVHGQRGRPPENLELVVKKTEQYLRQALRKQIEETEA